MLHIEAPRLASEFGNLPAGILLIALVTYFKLNARSSSLAIDNRVLLAAPRSHALHLALQTSHFEDRPARGTMIASNAES